LRLALKATQPSAAELGDHCLTYLVQNPEQLAEFMSIAGLSPDSLRRAVASGTITAGLIDYVAQNEPLLLAVCEQAAISPDTFMRVWAKLNPAG
jgi:hypothetical protein